MTAPGPSRAAQLAGEIADRLKPKWQRYDGFRQSAANRFVLTDLTVDGLNTYLPQMLLAKYLSWELDATPRAFVFDTRALPAEARSLAQAFGCTETFNLGAIISQLVANDRTIATAGQRLIQGWPTEGRPLRDALLGLTFDGLPVGDLIYDTHLRQTGKPTITRLDDRLVGHIRDAYLYYKAAQAVLDSGKIVAVLTLHMVYYHLGILSRLALARGIPVIQNLCMNPFRIKRFGSFLQARDAVGRFDHHEFERVFRQERPEAETFARAYLDRRFAGKAELGFKDGVEGAYGASRRRYEKEELCRSLGWDPAKPIAVLMSHVFHEAPHAVGDNLYADYYDWLAETLEVAARTPQVNWLLKKHPQQKYFDDILRGSPDLVPDDEAMRRLLAPVQGAAHVALCPPDLHTVSLIAAAHVIVTQHGRAGYEFAACGVPVVTTARAAYGGHGFTVEPKSRAAYVELLGRLETLSPLDETQKARALTYIYLFFEKSRIRSTLLPDIENRGFWAPPCGPEMLEAVLERIEDFEPREDPLFLRVQSMVRHGYTGLLDLDLPGDLP